MAGTSSSRSSPTPSDRRLAVARIIGAKGLAGAVRIEMLTDWPERIEPGAELWLDGAPTPTPHRCASRPAAASRSLHLDGVTDRDAAEALTGRYLETPARVLPDQTYYWDDLVGLHVEEPDGTPSASSWRCSAPAVPRCIASSARRASGSIPALRTAVVRIDLEENLMVVAPDDAEEVR